MDKEPRSSGERRRSCSGRQDHPWRDCPGAPYIERPPKVSSAPRLTSSQQPDSPYTSRHSAVARCPKDPVSRRAPSEPQLSSLVFHLEYGVLRPSGSLTIAPVRWNPPG